MSTKTKSSQAASISPNGWYLIRSGKLQGPYSAQELSTALEQGKFGMQELVVGQKAEDEIVILTLERVLRGGGNAATENISHLAPTPKKTYERTESQILASARALNGEKDEAFKEAAPLVKKMKEEEKNNSKEAEELPKKAIVDDLTGTNLDEIAGESVRDLSQIRKRTPSDSKGKGEGEKEEPAEAKFIVLNPGGRKVGPITEAEVQVYYHTGEIEDNASVINPDSGVTVPIEAFVGAPVPSKGKSSQDSDKKSSGKGGFFFVALILLAAAGGGYYFFVEGGVGGSKVFSSKVTDSKSYVGSASVSRIPTRYMKFKPSEKVNLGPMSYDIGDVGNCSQKRCRIEFELNDMKVLAFYLRSRHEAALLNRDGKASIQGRASKDGRVVFISKVR